MAAPSWRCLRRIADYAFALEGTDPDLRELAEELYSGARAEEGEPAVCFSLARQGDSFALLRDRAPVGIAPDLAGLFQEAEWALTEVALLRLGHFYQLHAGAVAWAGGAQVLAGPPESGKTSLVLALAERGGAVLTDEIALLEPGQLRVAPFRRDLILRPGTQGLFPLFAASAPGFKQSAAGHYLSPCGVGAPPPQEPVALSQLVFPVLRLGAGVEVRRIGVAEAARRLLEQSLNLGDWEAKGVELVGRLAEEYPALEVVFGDARAAASEIPVMAKAHDRKAGHGQSHGRKGWRGWA